MHFAVVKPPIRNAAGLKPSLNFGGSYIEIQGFRGDGETPAGTIGGNVYEVWADTRKHRAQVCQATGNAIRV